MMSANTFGQTTARNATGRDTSRPQTACFFKSPTPSSSFLTPNVPVRTRAEAGATLLVTLGILTILSVMVVAFLLTARHQSLSSKHFRDKTVARQALDVALVRAMQFADQAMIASNHSDYSSSPSSAERNRRRVAPVGRWYSKAYDIGNKLSSQIDYQGQDVLLVPLTNNPASSQTDALTVDLLTDEVRRLLPPALTNRFGSTANPLRSGWITDLNGGIRVSFAVLNCSGFTDAHTYDFTQKALRSATQHVDRAFFTRQDLVNANLIVNPEDLDACGVLSYDQGPGAIPLYPTLNSVHPSLGYREFSITNKFNINSVTNYFDPKNGRIKATRQFEERWLKIVTNELAAADRFSDNHADVTLGSVQKVAWNIANYMSPSRVPVISYPGVEIASRADYGIEDVPLVNEVQVFKCTDQSGRPVGDMFDKAVNDIATDLQNRFSNYGSSDKQWEPIVTTNFYAAAVEVWYPFAPHAIPYDTRVYVGVYTNQGDVTTTTNSNWSAADLADYYGLNDPSLAELYLFELNDDLRGNPDFLTNTTFWAAIKTDSLLVSAIDDPRSFNETNLLPIASGLAVGLVWVYTDPATGLIATNNPYTDVIYKYAPADTNLTPVEVTNYYATATNYIPAVTALLTNRVEDLFLDGGGVFAQGSQTVNQHSLPASKVAVGPFDANGPDCFTVGPLKTFEFNDKGFCVVTNYNTLKCFPAFEESENSRRIVFHPLGDLKSGAPSVWIRPLVAINEGYSETASENGGFEAVDEALLTPPEDSKDGTVSVMQWTEEASYSVADPRANAWYSSKSAVPTWYPARNTFGSTNEMPLSVTAPGVSELPFIHANAPFRSIGEMGYIPIDLDAKENNKLYRPHLPEHDTIDFSTRVGAATLDRFTIASTNAPMYGLIQANTTYDRVIRQILDGIPMGWTNDVSFTGVNDEHAFLLYGTDNEAAQLTTNWTNTLCRTTDYGYDAYEADNNGRPGWSSFADMLPDLSTNALSHLTLDFAARDKGTSEDRNYYTHDYIEDVMRGIIDKVSFRQNIYVVIIAAQTLSPASTDTHPVILADQRAAVTVIRDAYTGRWLIHSWVWLTE